MFALIALFLLFAFLVLGGGVRVWIQRRRTGDSGVRRPTTPVQLWSRATFGVGILLAGAAAPASELLGVPALSILDRPVVRVAGVVVSVIGLLATFGAQLAMGDSWRSTVDLTERPALVTDGPFRIVRNPVYTAVIMMVAGLALVVPSLIAIVGLGVVIVGSELQVRLVEEPYLRQVHDGEYLSYASHTGRFLPGLGRLT
ncbi:Protein-S-isoprenylcysteine O-methyltransferase Ste14 [Lentzea albidocapillata subsp. violacea]|uniref:Protein-S-isoprenylcysteine O-methyltransferase Ste14 n=1 Tax=Lentzea albidocapillata subsp. violacea TaxID=128104 RepID=A0A1G9S6V5_9PSEU|nr:isoprenylcysteine carboxylmethyltransferase family protein [Lentzea albidocapillata]SDM30495.1 Protein-S-isoprenylcysteine O-methyltransferase Ste14 [Lentzea albidocapillata subsp. violacea]